MKAIRTYRSNFNQPLAFVTTRTSAIVGAAGLWGLLALAAWGQTDLIPASGPNPQAPPPAPPVETRLPSEFQSEFFIPMPPEGSTPYSIGNPTDEEQLYLEFINRARGNPPHEGWIFATTSDPDVLGAYVYFGVDTNLMQSQFNAIAVTPPLAMNAQLLAAARLHSGHMFTNQYQGHYETNGIWSPGDRITTQGYNWSTYGENVFSYSESVFYGHAGFEVDWGYGTGGMQDPPGHRLNTHNSAFREVGVGVVNGVNGAVGPQLVTQDLATRQSATPLITGVVYYDLNGNSFYDAGEGIGGVTVQVPGSAYFAITANSGGYAVPVTTNGSYAMSFSATGLSSNRTATVSNLYNAKVDYVPPYSPPTITGPNPAALSNNNTYAFTTVGAATNHQYVITRLSSYTAVEGAENGSNFVTYTISPGYSLFASDVRESGTYSFHFCHPTNTAMQSLTLNASLLPRTNCQLIFAKRLGWASSGQVARAQVSTNGGSLWQDIWTQAGTGGGGDSSFSRVTNSLGAFAGVSTRLRFVYAFTSGSYFPQTSSGVGFYLDNLTVTNADQAQNPVTNNVASGNTFGLNPTNTDIYLLSVSAQLPGRTLPAGPAFRLTVSNLPPMAIKFMGRPTRTGSQFQADFTVTNYPGGALFTVLKSSDLRSGWTTDTVATVQTIVSNTQFRVTTSSSTNRLFLRLRVN
jgi:hypothetical protein